MSVDKKPPKKNMKPTSKSTKKRPTRAASGINQIMKFFHIYLSNAVEFELAKIYMVKGKMVIAVGKKLQDFIINEEKD